MTRELNVRQTAFVSHYIGDCFGVGSQAARKAGYAGNDQTLRAVAHKLLTNAHIIEAIAEHKAQVSADGIADRTNRLAMLNDLAGRLMRTIQARAEDPKLAHVSGGPEGVIVHQLRGIGHGDDYQVVDEYTVDNATSAELRATLKQAAQDAGQWTERNEYTGKNGAPLVPESVPPNPADVVAVLSALSRAGSLSGISSPDALQPGTTDGATDGISAHERT